MINDEDEEEKFVKIKAFFEKLDKAFLKLVKPIPFLLFIFYEKQDNVFFFMDNDEDVTYEFRIPLFYHRIKFRIENFFNDTKYFLQRVFRRNHTADIDLWSLDFCLARYIYPRLLAFKKIHRMGYPSDFSEYSENEWETKEKYDEAIKEGKIIGGGPDKWEETLDEIIFAFDWKINCDDHRNDKQRDEFYKRYNYKNPHLKTDDNACIEYVYKTKNDGRLFSHEELTPEEVQEKEYKFIAKRTHYYDVKYDMTIMERAQDGFKLFGKYFQNMWD
jgi:hypothetical protein